MLAEQVLNTQKTVVWIMEKRGEGERKRLNMSISKFGQISKWRPNHGENSGLVTGLGVSHVEVVTKGMGATGALWLDR